MLSINREIVEILTLTVLCLNSM